MRASALALALALPVPATAGGYEEPGAYGAVPNCAALTAPGRAFLQDGRVVVIREASDSLLRARPRVEHIRGRFCRRPTGTSDRLWSGGAGYIIKNDTRAVIGCAP